MATDRSQNQSPKERGAGTSASNEQPSPGRTPGAAEGERKSAERVYEKQRESVKEDHRGMKGDHAKDVG